MRHSTTIATAVAVAVLAVPGAALARQGADDGPGDDRGGAAVTTTTGTTTATTPTAAGTAS
ncbi:MAG: hypothetical protein Q7T67_06990, partial [Patulibacter sp.]